MTNWQDYYKILQVDPAAEPEIIESAYRRLCKKYHPDINRSRQSEEVMKRLNLAYSVLGSESSRRQYHLQWLNRIKKAETESVSEKSAISIMQKYFTAISRKDYQAAYGLLTAGDRTRISIQDYQEWQEAVAAIYAISGFQIGLVSKYLAFQGSSSVYKNAYQLEITTRERNLKTGDIAAYQTTKTAVYEHPSWRVYLGYDDLGPLIEKFCRLNQGREESFQSFQRSAKKEVSRYARYGTAFSLAAFKIFLKGDAGLTETVSARVGRLISENIRENDISTPVEDSVFLVLFAQTHGPGGQEAAKKISLILKRDLETLLHQETHVPFRVAGCSGEPLAKIIEFCLTGVRQEV